MNIFLKYSENIYNVELITLHLRILLCKRAPSLLLRLFINTRAKPLPFTSAGARQKCKTAKQPQYYNDHWNSLAPLSLTASLLPASFTDTLICRLSIVKAFSNLV